MNTKIDSIEIADFKSIAKDRPLHLIWPGEGYNVSVPNEGTTSVIDDFARSHFTEEFYGREIMRIYRRILSL